MKRVMCVWLPRWPIQRLLQTRPDLKRRPLVLHVPAARGGFQVLVCSRPAADKGIKPAMPLAEAQALADTLARSASEGALYCEPHDPRADRTALQQLAWWCQQFTPFVGLEEDDLPESLLLDITGCAHLFGGEAQMAEHVTAEFSRRDLYVRSAIADTIGAAWAAAHYGPDGPPLPCTHGRGETSETLNPLPIQALRLPAAVVEALRALDIRTIGQVRALPRSTLPSRFGPDLLWRLDQALGSIPELLHPERPPDVIEAEWSADFALRNRRHIETVLRELITQIAGRVHARGQGVQHLRCSFQGEKQPPVQMSIRLLNATVSVRHLFELVCLQLERQLLPGEISRVHVRVLAAGPLATQVITLWDGEGKCCHGRDVEQMLERLSCRLGDDAVLRPQLAADAQPEYEWRGARDAGREKCTAHSSLLATRHSPLVRPLCVLAVPESIEVWALAPEGPPLRFYWQQEEHTLRWSWGPERIETGWWRGEHIRRDYYRVETLAGQWFWLFRRREDGCWFLHGAFN